MQCNSIIHIEAALMAYHCRVDGKVDHTSYLSILQDDDYCRTGIFRTRYIFAFFAIFKKSRK